MCSSSSSTSSSSTSSSSSSVNFVSALADMYSGRVMKQDNRIAKGKSSHSILVSTEELSHTMQWSLRGRHLVSADSGSPPDSLKSDALR